MNKDLIAKLVGLQAVDAQIRELENSRERIPLELDEYMELLTREEKTHHDFEHGLKQKKLLIKEKNGILKSNEEQMQKQRVLLNAAKSNKEYDTIKMQINKLDKENHLMEEEILVMMEEVDAAAVEEGRLKKKADEARLAYENLKKENDQKLAEFDVTLEELRKTRKEKAANVPTNDLHKYERICKAVGGKGIVEVVNGACGGCYSVLPPQTANDIVRVNDFVLCEHCSRILYVNDSYFNNE